MKILSNNLVFDYKGEDFNVPLDQPWNIYQGELKPAGDYEDRVNRNIGDQINYMILHLTESCNLACKYCFLPEKSASKMTDNEIKQIIDYLCRENPEDINIRFFGGEPLLEVDTIEKIINEIDLALEKNNLRTKVQYNIFTNGTILNDRIIDLIRKNKMYIFTSFDGSKEMHDSNRIYKNGKGTYETVLENIKSLNEAFRGKLIIRCVYDTSQTRLSIVDIVDEMFSNGIETLSIEFPWMDCHSKFSLDESKKRDIKAQIESFADEYVNRLKEGDYSLIGVAPFAKIIGYLLNEKDFFDTRACAAGCEAVAVSTNGDLYPCHFFVGKDEFKLGNLQDGITNHDMRNKFLEISTEHVESCTSCPIKYLCISSCIGDSLLFNNDLHKPNTYRCEIQKEVVKSCFYIFHFLKDNPEIKRRVRVSLAKHRRIYTAV